MLWNQDQNKTQYKVTLVALKQKQNNNKNLTKEPKTKQKTSAWKACNLNKGKNN